MSQIPIPVHVGSEPLAHWDDIEARQLEYGEEAAPWLQKQRRPAIASASLDWSALGFEPRWVGFDTADCAAALQPSIFSGQGANEFDRFRQGAASRDELALVISPVGQLGGSDPLQRSVFSSNDGSVTSAGWSRPSRVGRWVWARGRVPRTTSVALMVNWRSDC
jgi:hypothetical protein